MTTKPKPTETFRALLKARNTLLWVTSAEERRAERAIASVAQRDEYRVIFWDCASGARDVEGEPIEMTGPSQNPQSVFASIRERSRRSRDLTITEEKGGKVTEKTVSVCRELWILRDLADWLNPVNTRGIKTLARDLQDEMDPWKLAAVVVLGPSSEVPLTLQGATVMLDWPLPPREEIGKILDDVLRAAKVEINGDRDAVVDAAAGLAADDIAGAFALSIVRHGRVDPGEVAHQKKLIIDKEPTLQWYEPEPRGLDAIGGLDYLKEWLEERRVALSPEAREYGLPAPRGVLLAGIPGTGKSLAAKAVATAWGLPLLRLDLGACRGSLVGQSEQAIRRALKIAEAVAPAILWLDELEKGLAGSDSRGDGGVAADALSTLLTWMQERQGSVFVVATANQVQTLPPELTRRGRFDDVFFVDLPTRFEREAIAAVALVKRRRDPAAFRLRAIADATESFTGAEIEACVESALFRSFRDGARDLTTDDVLAATRTLVPMATSSREQIAALRQWAEGRARRASAPETTARTPAPAGSGYGRTLDIATDTETVQDDEEN